MKIWNRIERYPEDAGRVVATIGNYDGVHRGHRVILSDVVAAARALRGSSLLITFDPHPLEVVAPERRPQLLQTRGQKLESLEETGLDAVLILAFDTTLAAMTGEQFFEAVLDRRVDLAEVRIGENFRFGHDRAGGVELLTAIGARRKFEVGSVSPVEIDGGIVSSSRIRQQIRDGQVESAAAMLGRPYTIRGEVTRGDGRGRKLRYPTANLSTRNELLPGNGVYVTEVVTGAARQAAVSNVGIRPTFHSGGTAVETHLIDFEGNLYGERMEVRFLARIRDEQKFADGVELSNQIARDLAAAEAFFENGRLAPL
ncbi:MAG: bifunctional riboflavin kinase/FAD synthetase [Acidobacteria bacterium]|uniref:Riboflavin biosynthesis protein n=1 Tax=Candidatus Polarisedimenticola svalbardensis TaxID=2886004 RepID=A0A8J6XY37_9BACT|nr:bifunctional riboflavin kinase/FAD synthetase [Candidatus Polarisedimenticola svalbardensis]